jgi:hypothetical protein
MAHSSELTGGTGFVYEGHVAAYFLAALLTGEVRPPLNSGIKTVALQQSAYGAPLDDIIATFDDAFEAKLHIQVKRSLTISAADSNKDFREVVKGSWLTYKNPKNHSGYDYYGAATDTISSASLRNVKTVCQAARHSHSEAVFFSRKHESGTASIEFEGFIEDIRKILSSAQLDFTDFELHNFLKNFVIFNFDVMTSESISNSETINRLSQILIAPSRAHDLWEYLKNISREGAGVSATYSHESLKRILYPLFKFKDKDKDSQINSTVAPSQVAQPILERACPLSCSVAISNVVAPNRAVTLTAIIVTDDLNKLASEVRGWKEKLKRSSLLTRSDKDLVDERSLSDLIKQFQFASILLQDLATADFSAYIYYARGGEVNEWPPERLEIEVAVIPLFHRLSNKNEIAETVYSEIENIEFILASAVAEVKNKYHRSVNSIVSTSYARNRKEILELSDLVAEVSANYLSNGSTYPKEYMAYIKTRIRYGENIATGEKHKRDKNPIA